MSRIDPNPEVLATLDELLAHSDGRRLGLLGYGVAGRAMAREAVERGFELVIVDRRADIDLQGLTATRRPEADDVFNDCEGLIISPGADPRQAMVRAVRDRGAPVFGELELTGALPMVSIAITGTNGKSTTTAWLGHLAKRAGRKTFVGGNLGLPLITWSHEEPDAELVVAELSSFQLETAYRARFHVGAILNITPDHGERYDRFEDYVAAKSRLIENLSAEDVAVLNADDPVVVSLAQKTKATVHWFGRSALPGDHGVTLDGDLLVGQGAASTLSGFDLSSTRLVGAHNRANGMAALLCANAAGLEDLSAYATFAGLPDRLEFVGEVSGVRYINDSKATNDESAATAVLAMDRPVVLLCGGIDKAGGYGKLAQASDGRVRAAVCYGEAGPLVAEALGSHTMVSRTDRFAEAFKLASELAEAGEVVLLAPACSSFDEFENYRARGQAFRVAVAGLEGGGS